MKIEMGESIIYSWLRHVNGCQIVQTNWKTSSEWTLKHEGELETIKNKAEEYFLIEHNCKIFKKTSSLRQLLKQTECDAIGINSQGIDTKIYAVEVAFHEGGLSYGDKETTITKIIAKMIRTAMCIYGYFDIKNAVIIFASPKINASILYDLKSRVEEVGKLMDSMGYVFKFEIKANADFNENVLKPVTDLSNHIADEAELFLRAYKMIHLFN